MGLIFVHCTHGICFAACLLAPRGEILWIYRFDNRMEWCLGATAVSVCLLDPTNERNEEAQSGVSFVPRHLLAKRTSSSFAESPSHSYPHKQLMHDPLA
mmetsp:Transcript_339/g.1239  ORF Transcript_339/g.1239 Transcript_339/m.1239 type:complete len:99 (+) Transcript_339:2094-2390(+)